MSPLKILGRFLAAAWLDGVAAFLVIAAAGLAEGAAFALALWLSVAVLKAYALGPLLELVGLERPPRRRLALARELLLAGIAVAALLVLSTLAGRPLAAEPFSLAVLLEAAYSIPALAARVLARPSARSKE